MDVDSDLNTRVTAVPGPRSAHTGVDCFVVIYAPAHSQLGRRYTLERAATTIGRGRDNDIVLLSDCVSRQHVRIERRANGLFSVDLASTNGTYINDSIARISEHALRPGDQVKVGDTILKFLSGSDVESQYHDIIFSMTITDGLTNVANRKQLDTLLNDEIVRARRHNLSLSMLMLDIDHFKQVNDTYGHQAGDAVLRGLAALIKKRLRPTDTLGRYGGEEFCALLPETTLQGAAAIAEELRAMIASHTFVADKQEIKATLSIGAGTLHPNMQADALYKSADEKLYAAKRTGRNKVCC
jgi:two-component system cell cycle response regulator